MARRVSFTTLSTLGDVPPRSPRLLNRVAEHAEWHRCDNHHRWIRALFLQIRIRYFTIVILLAANGSTFTSAASQHKMVAIAAATNPARLLSPNLIPLDDNFAPSSNTYSTALSSSRTGVLIAYIVSYIAALGSYPATGFNVTVPLASHWDHPAKRGQ